MVQKILLFAFLSFLFTSCSKEDDDTNLINPELSVTSSENSKITSQNPFKIVINEDFDQGTKSTYSPDSIILSTGKWYFDNALIGKNTEDVKFGTSAARITGNGSITLKIDTISTLLTIKVSHATFGQDYPSTWGLFISTNNGISFKQYGQTIESNSTIQQQVFTIGLRSTIIIQIRKLSGGTDQLNFDNISFTNAKPVIKINVIAPADNDNLLLGNPSMAQNNILLIDNYLMNKGEYILSYNRTNGTPNWVSWYVGSNSLGTTPRQDDFRADNTLPLGWYPVGSTSYSGSGFDRGHNCPSADRNSSVPANSSTFLMTNIIPQAPYNNQQTWGNFEDYTRSLVNAGNEVFIVMGSYGVGGTGNNGFRTSINNGNVKVPARIWKVVVVIPNGTRDINRITNTTRVIAIDTPNSNGISNNWRTFRTSVDAIETATGYDILSALTQSIQNDLESKIDSL